MGRADYVGQYAHFSLRPVVNFLLRWLLQTAKSRLPHDLSVL